MFGAKNDMFNGMRKINENKRDGRMSSDTLSSRKTFFLLTSLLSLLATSTDLDEAIDEFLKVDGDLQFIHKLFIYLKLPKDMLENLLSDDEMIAGEEIALLRSYIFELIGTGSIYDFVDYAMEHAPSIEFLEKYESDSADEHDMDWAFYTTKKACKTQLGKKKSGEFSKACESGQRKGVSGFWLYPKSFEHPATKGISGTNHTPRKSLKTKPFKKHKATADNKASTKKNEKIADKRAKEHGVKPKGGDTKASLSKEDLFREVGV